MNKYLSIIFLLFPLFLLSGTNTYATDNEADNLTEEERIQKQYQWYSQTHPLIIKGSNDYPPFEFINKFGQPDGFNIDLFRALMVELQLSYSLKLDKWNVIQKELENHEIDVIIGMIFSKERAKQFKFGLPTCIINRDIISLKDNTFHKIEDLKGKVVAAQLNGWAHNYLIENNITNKILPVNNMEEAIKLLTNNKCDAIFGSDLVAFQFIKEKGIKNIIINHTKIEAQRYTFAVNNENDELAYLLNMGLQQLKISGEYDKIYNKWFGVYEYKNAAMKFLWFFLAIIIASIFLVISNKRLQILVKRKTKELSSMNAEMGLAIDSGNLAAWSYSISSGTFRRIQGNLMLKNNKSLSFHNYTITELKEEIHPDDKTRVLNSFERLISGEVNKLIISFRLNNIDNEEVYCQSQMQFIKDKDEKNNRIIGTIKDISNDTILQRNLEDHKFKTDFITKSSDLSLWEYSNKTHTFVSLQADSSISNFNSEAYLSLVHPDDIPTAKQRLMMMDNATEIIPASEYRIFSPTTKTYNWYVVETIAFKRNSNGNIISYVGLRRNNSKWKKITDDLIILRDKAEEANRLKSSFLANMSHEIRTPLNAIVGFSRIIAETPQLPDEKKERFVNAICQNNDMLLQLINDIIDISKIESGVLTFNNTIFDVNSLLNEIAIDIEQKLKGSKTRLIILPMKESITICADKIRLTQVFNNLLTNAIKFTKEGHITICAYLLGSEYIRFSVSDTGCGIPNDKIESIFERFVKLDAFSQGTGLGLYICQTIIGIMEGKIGVKSIVNQGSEFWFTIPINSKSNSSEQKGNC